LIINVSIHGFTVVGATGWWKSGIYLYYADHCNFTNNNCSNNHYGIWLSDSSNWNDYKERYLSAEEIDGTGIWDSPYIINPYIKNSDRDNYPLVNSFENYEIGTADSEGRQQLVEAIEELELAIIDSIATISSR